MKKLRNLIGIMLLMAIITAIGATALSDDEVTITIKNNTTVVSGTTFYGYKLLSASTSESDGTLNATYTVNETYRSILQTVVNTLDTENTYTDGQPTDEQIKNYIGKFNDNSDEIREFADEVYKEIKASTEITADATSSAGVFSNIDEAYWLIASSDASSLVIVDTAGKSSIEVQLKPVGVPTIEKNVKEDSNSTWQKYADYDTGDTVPFQIIGTLPTTDGLASYETYKYVFTDTLSSGLTYEEDSLKVYAVQFSGNNEISRTEIKKVDTGSDGYILNVADKNITITFNDLKSIKSADDTAINLDGTYKIIAEYNAALSISEVSAKGENNTAQLEYSNDPYTESTTDKTTTTETKVFSYELIINKTDGSGNKLAGADFTLQKKNSDNAYEDIAAANIKKVYYKWNDELNEGAGGYEETTTAAEAARFAFIGLDAGDYKLIESKTPSGYNGLADTEFSIAAQIDSNSLEISSLTAAGFSNDDENKAILSISVQNKMGTELPSTGGKGRAAVYILGSIMVIGAAVLLITKKRMNSK